MREIYLFKMHLLDFSKPKSREPHRTKFSAVEIILLL